MKYARVINDIAVDVVAGDPAAFFVPSLAAQFIAVPDEVEAGSVRLQNIVGTALAAGTSWHPPRTFIEEYLEGTFRYALRPAPPSTLPPAPAPDRRVKPIAYRNRFLPSEKVAIELAAAHDPGASTQAKQAAAALRAALADVMAAPYIDLDDARPQVGVRARTQGLEAAGILGPGRALQILDAEIQPHEAYTG